MSSINEVPKPETAGENGNQQEDEVGVTEGQAVVARESVSPVDAESREKNERLPQAMVAIADGIDRFLFLRRTQLRARNEMDSFMAPGVRVEFEQELENLRSAGKAEVVDPGELKNVVSAVANTFGKLKPQEGRAVRDDVRSLDGLREDIQIIFVGVKELHQRFAPDQEPTSALGERIRKFDEFLIQKHVVLKRYLG